MNKNNVNRRSIQRKNELSTGGWSFWNYEDLMPRLFRIFTGSTSKPKNADSRCGTEIKKLITNFPEHKEHLQLVGKIIELNDSSNSLDSIAKEKMRKLDWLNEQQKEFKIHISDIESKLEREIEINNHLAIKIRKVSEEKNSIQEANIAYLDKKIKKNNPILWSQSLDTVWEYNPLLVEKLEKSSKLFPKEYDNSKNIKLEGEVKYLTMPKEERISSRYSEDRVGYSLTKKGFRAVAIDGVGGSSHPRVLVREIGKDLLSKSAITKKEQISKIISRTMKRVGDSMDNDGVQFATDDKLAFFQKQKLAQGAACVMAFAEYDGEGTMQINQIGDTMAFVERNDDTWEIIPENLSNGEMFNSMPSQLNCLDQKTIKGLEETSIDNSTGRVLLATDGIAEYIINNGGIVSFLDLLKNCNKSGETLINVLKRGNIADDDLSFILIEPQKQSIDK